MKDYKKEYYEQITFWNYDYSKKPAEKDRIQKIINLIPIDALTMLDVGCGNGSFVNFLINGSPNRFNKVVGIDSSKEAVKYVKTEKIDGAIDDLPFKDESFDLVTCLEVLEHLPQKDFKKGISELQRVSKKYIIVTVPNMDNLEHSLVMCPKCFCWFNPYFHMRSFNKDILYNLFKDFKSIKIEEIGPTIEFRSYNRLLLTLYRAWRKPFPPETAICPQCGYQHRKGEVQNIENNNSNHSISNFLLLFKLLTKMIWPLKKKRRWLLVIYEKAYR